MQKMRLNDLESVKKGAVDCVDGVVLLASGMFRLVAFSVLTAWEGLRVLLFGKRKSKVGEKGEKWKNDGG